MSIYLRARRRVEQCDLDIVSETKFVSDLEERDLDATMAKAILARLISRRATDLNEMELLLDALETLPSGVSGGHDEEKETTPEKAALDLAD